MSPTAAETARSNQPDISFREYGPHPSDTKMTESTTGLLLGCVLGLLTPLLMAGGISDITVARRAAQQAIEATIADGHTGLLTAAQIVAFALTALDNLRLSMNEDGSLLIKLRLRANATALIRATVRPAETPRQPRPPKPVSPKPVTAEKPAPMEAAPPVTPRLPERQSRQHWADAMKTAAANLRVNDADVSPAQRKTDQLWIEVLNDVANELRKPAQPNTGMRRTDLLRTTLMSGNQGFPIATLIEKAAHQATQSKSAPADGRPPSSAG